MQLTSRLLSPTLETLLRRLTLGCIAAALFLSALVYPWMLPESLFAHLETQPAKTSFWAWLYHDQLRSQVQYTHSTLVYKETVAQAFLLAGLAAFLLLMMLRALREEGTNVIEGSPARLRNWLANPNIWALALLVYLSLTVFGIRSGGTNAAGSAGSGGWVILPGSPTFHYSLRTWFAFALGVFAVLAIPALRVDRHWTVKIMAGLTLCGVVVAFVALLEHVGLAKFFLPASADARNRMSSLIGHNTGMSSWMMFPLSFALYFSVVSRRAGVRWIARAATALFLFVILAAQSRAIWVLAAAITLFSVVAYFRIFAIRVHRRSFLIGAAIVLALIAIQTVGPQWNRFARTPVPLFTRLKNDVLNLDQLRRETRLRILVVSFNELITKRPITGTGFGTFQWVYPPAQGKYLRENLDTLLGYTIKRTDLAHNDYIQLLVEAGLIGCVLLGVPVVLLLRRGRRAYAAAVVPHDRALLVSLTLPLAAVSLHAFVDFPYHVVPIAMEAAVCLGLLAAARGWIGASDPATSILPSPVLETGPLPLDANPRVRWKAVVGLAAAASALFWIPLATRNLVYREFASDIYQQFGQRLLQTFHAAPQSNTQLRKALLDGSLGQFRNAIVTNVFNGAAYEGQASAFSYRGYIFLQNSKLAAADHQSSEAATLQAAARGDFESAIRAATNQRHNGELLYHFTYYIIGNSYRGLWALNPDASDIRQVNYLKSARQAYELAIETNVADTHSLLALSEILDQKPLNDLAAAAKYRRLMFKIDPDYAQRMLLDPPLKAAETGDAVAALGRLDRLQQNLPDVKRITAARVLTYFYKSVWPPAELDKVDTPASASLAWRRETIRPGEALLNSILDDEIGQKQVADQLPRLTMLYAAAKGEFDKALQIAEGQLKIDKRNWEAMAMRDVAIEQLHKGKPAELTDVPHDRFRNLYRLYFGGDKQLASFNIGSFAYKEKLTIHEATRVLAFYQHNGWSELTSRLLSVVIKAYPAEPALQKYIPAQSNTGGQK